MAKVPRNAWPAATSNWTSKLRETSDYTPLGRGDLLCAAWKWDFFFPKVETNRQLVFSTLKTHFPVPMVIDIFRFVGYQKTASCLGLEPTTDGSATKTAFYRSKFLSLNRLCRTDKRRTTNKKTRARRFVVVGRVFSFSNPKTIRDSIFEIVPVRAVSFSSR